MLDTFFILVVMIFGLVVVVGSRKYKDKKFGTLIRIKAANRILSGQDLIILIGSISCCIIVPALCIISAEYNANDFAKLLKTIFANPLAVVCLGAMVLAPVGIALCMVYKAVVNIINACNADFVKEIVLNDVAESISVYYNKGEQIIPYALVNGFKVYVTNSRVPKVNTGAMRAGLSSYKSSGNMLGASLCGMSGLNSGTADVVTAINIVISTCQGQEVSISTLGHPLFDSGSEKLLKELKRYKTKFENFEING